MKTRRVRSNSGTTLIELMVALAITVIIVAGAYEAFVNLHNWWISQGIRSEMGQNARAALNVLTQDIEAAGSKTSGYGDTQKDNLAITNASPHEIELDEYKYYPVKTPSGSTPGYQHTMVYYHVATDPNTGMTNLYRQLRTTPDIPQPDQLVAENISNVSFRYYDQNNTQLTGMVTYTNTGSAPDTKLGQIRRIWVSVTAAASRTDPARNNSAFQRITLSASVIAKNLYSQEVLGSPNPPAVPTGLNVVDTGSCTRKLSVKWTANTDQDLAGYTLYYGMGGSMQVPVQSLSDPTHPQVYLNADEVLITKSNAASPNRYSITIDAYSSDGLHSAPSAPVSENPSPSVSTFGGGNDTTVNPVKPSPPTSLVIAPTGNNKLVLTWHVPADGSATAGYRLFRNASSFNLNTNISSKLIADENKLGPNTTTFTDTGV